MAWLGLVVVLSIAFVQGSETSIFQALESKRSVDFVERMFCLPVRSSMQYPADSPWKLLWHNALPDGTYSIGFAPTRGHVLQGDLMVFLAFERSNTLSLREYGQFEVVVLPSAMDDPISIIIADVVPGSRENASSFQTQDVVSDAAMYTVGLKSPSIDMVCASRAWCRCRSTRGVPFAALLPEAVLYAFGQYPLLLPADEETINVLDHRVLIEFLRRRYNYRSYLEIGCRDDETFSVVGFETMVGVDPVSGGTLRMTSDEFFEQTMDSFDVIFIDGLHRGYQVKKDIQNSLQILNRNGVIVCHDTLPRSATEAAESMAESLHGAWTGDVWRGIVWARSQPSLRVATLNCDWGLTVIQPWPGGSRKPAVVSAEEAWTIPFGEYASRVGDILEVMTVRELEAWLHPPSAQ